ncbi:hypothetical protein C0J50_22900, partial [Silurus asotus]
MLLSVLSLWGSLLTLVASQSCPDPSENSATWVRLKPLGQCKDGESTCPYRITLPSLTIQLPKPFRDLEKMVKELQSLTQMVNQLREDCRECKERQGMDWSTSTDDEREDGERIQASEKTFNTRDSQQDIAEREHTVQVTTSRSAVEDSAVVISSEAKDENPTAFGKQWNTNQERNVNQHTTKPRSEKNGGTKGFNPLREKTISESISKVGEVPSLTTAKKKILQFPLAELTESSIPRDREQPTQESQKQSQGQSNTNKVRNEMYPGTLTAKGKVKSIPEYHVVSMTTEDVDDNDYDKEDDNEDDDDDVETKQLQTPKGENVPGEKQPVTGTDAQNNRELEPRIKQLPRKQQDKENKKAVADTGLKELRSSIFEDTNNRNVAKEGSVSVVQEPTFKNMKKNNHGERSTKLKVLKPGSHSESQVNLRPVNTDDTIRGQKKLTSPNTGRANASVNVSQINPQTLEIKSKNAFKSKLDGKMDTGVKLKFNSSETVNGQVITTSTIAGMTYDIADLGPTNPQTLDSIKKLNTGTDLEIDTVSQQERSESSISDSRRDVNGTNHSLNSKYDLPKNRNPKLNVTQPRNGKFRIPNPMSINNERRKEQSSNTTTSLRNDAKKSGRHLPTGDLPTSQGKQHKIKHQPERTSTGRINIGKDPRHRKPYILQRIPLNESKAFGSGRTKNTSGIIDYIMSQTESSTNNELNSTVYGMGQSVRPTLAPQGVVDETHLKRTAPTVAVVHTRFNPQIESTSQATTTKQRPEHTGGHSGHAPVLDKAKNLERGSKLPLVEKKKDTHRRTEQGPFKTSRVDSNQKKTEKSLREGSNQHFSGQTPLVDISNERNGLNYATTAATPYTINTEFKNKSSKTTQFTAPIITTTHLLDQDHAEQAKTTSGVKVSNKQARHRLENPSQEIESKRSHSDTGNKELQSASNGQESSAVTNLQPNSLDTIQNIANGSTALILDKVIAGPGSKVSTTSTGHTNDGSNKKPLTVNNMDNRQGIEKQLLSNCHDQCDHGPTPQSILNSHESSKDNRDKLPQDCSDFMKNPKSGIYNVTPTGSGNTTFPVFCDMKSSGGGWTLIQHRLNGNVSFNRTWNDYKGGFGNLMGEFWLGNDKIHWLTTTKAMALRIELEDLDGIKEYAQYDQFHVANESQYYRLTIEGYSGTAGDAMLYSKKFNHNQKNFTTPDRDNDQYTSGNCGAYYSSGWWFDACMAANLNGKYYETRYKGVRNGIFWGTWHNISTESYPTNERQSFKTVRMMIRPR